MRRPFLLLVAPCLAFTSVLLATSREAHAGLALGVDGDFAVAPPSKTIRATRLGGGVTGRVGFRIDLVKFEVGPLFLTPEIGGGYLRFGSDYHPTRVFGGARFGLGSRVQPSIWGHAGYGYVGSVDYYANGKLQGFTADGGLSVEFQIVPTVGVGLNAGYFTNRTISYENTSQSINWFSFGGQVTINI